MQKRYKALAFKDVTSDCATSHIYKRRNKIDSLYEPIAHRATHRICTASWIKDNHRHFNGWLMKKILLAKPIISKKITMIWRENDHRVIQLACHLKVIQKTAQVIITLFENPRVGVSIPPSGTTY